MTRSRYLAALLALLCACLPSLESTDAGGDGGANVFLDGGLDAGADAGDGGSDAGDGGPTCAGSTWDGGVIRCATDDIISLEHQPCSIRGQVCRTSACDTDSCNGNCYVLVCGVSCEWQSTEQERYHSPACIAPGQTSCGAQNCQPGQVCIREYDGGSIGGTAALTGCAMVTAPCPPQPNCGTCGGLYCPSGTCQQVVAFTDGGNFIDCVHL